MAVVQQTVALLTVVLVVALAGIEAKCRLRDFQCNNGKCLPIELKCNCQDDCGDGSDEAFPVCNGLTLTCNDGGCLDISHKCDGFADCNDGSDEGFPLCSAPNITMQNGDVVTVRVGFNKQHGSVGFTMCGLDPSDVCIMAIVHGFGPSGSLYYNWNEKCTSEVDGGNCYEDVPGDMRNHYGFGSGDLTFLVAYTESNSMTVTLEGHPEQSFTVMGVWDFEADVQLRVRPFNWFADMPVTFSGTQHQH